MTAALLDVNILVALLWPAQESHEKVQNWFKRRSSEGWATCPFTQAAFIRIVSNPAFSPAAVSVEEARKALQESIAHSHHEFWRADLDYFEATRQFAHQIKGHRQVPDAYLLGLALHHRGRLATMDRGILDLVPSGLRNSEIVILV